MKSPFQEHVTETTLREHAQMRIKELRRFEARGEITNLKIDHVFPHIVNGVRVWELLVDAAYVDKNNKPKIKIFRSFLEHDSEELRLKISAIEAEYGINVEVIAI